MLALRRSEQLRSNVLSVCRKYLSAQSQAAVQTTGADDEYTEQPEYPEIVDPSFRGRKEQQSEDWREQIRQARTVEEKMIKINMPRYYGYKVVDLGDNTLPYNCRPAIQHYTRTVFEENLGSATVEAEQKTQLDGLVQAVKGDVQESLEFANDYFSHKYNGVDLEPLERERLMSQLVVEQLNRALINGLAAQYPHLHELEVDYNPRHEAFWSVGGIDPPKNVIKSKEGREWQKEMANDPVDRWLQYIGEPYLALRHKNQLTSWKQPEECENLALATEQIPVFKHDPRTLGYLTCHRHGTNIPGYWPGSASGFGCLSFQSRAHLNIRPDSFGVQDAKEALHAQAIQSSFAWLLAQANYNGFNTFSELSYPMNTQTIITNGRDWSFYEYQLNTLLTHTQHVQQNPKMNFCRGTAELQLYQEFDAAGKCIGLDEQVLRQLVKFYVNAPVVQRTPAELQPYLNEEVKRVADYENDDQSAFLEKTFKHMSTNRPRHLPIPEIYLWEKLYRIDNKTRLMEAKRRYFELDINPWRRTMDQHAQEYVPKALRPDVPKNKNRFKKTYYP